MNVFLFTQVLHVFTLHVITLTLRACSGNMSSPQALRDTSKMPVKLVAVYRELVGSNYKSRPNIGKNYFFKERGID